MNSTASILVSVERARVALEVINCAVEALSDAARHGGATWPLAGNAGKAAQDLEDLANFLTPNGGLGDLTDFAAVESPAISPTLDR